MSNMPAESRAKASGLAREIKMDRHDRKPDEYSKAGYQQAIDELDVGLGSGPGSLLEQLFALITVPNMTSADKASCVCAYFDILDDELAAIYRQEKA